MELLKISEMLEMQSKDEMGNKVWIVSYWNLYAKFLDKDVSKVWKLLSGSWILVINDYDQNPTLESKDL